ncbi:hypothetical protein DRQ20_02910 [bacterium]|nr:MAG: hypothetical protein DRQ20_02910 [bacterium]
MILCDTLGFTGSIFASGDPLHVADYEAGVQIYLFTPQGISLPEKPASFDFSLRFTFSRGSIAVRFSLPHPTHVNLEIYDVLGRVVKKILDKDIEPGMHKMNCNFDEAPGVYFLKFTAGSYEHTEKVMVVR